MAKEPEVMRYCKAKYVEEIGRSLPFTQFYSVLHSFTQFHSVVSSLFYTATDVNLRDYLFNCVEKYP